MDFAQVGAMRAHLFSPWIDYNEQVWVGLAYSCHVMSPSGVSMVKGCLHCVITSVDNLADVNSGPVSFEGAYFTAYNVQNKHYYDVLNTHRPLSEGSIICSRSKAKKFLPSLLW